MNKPTGVMRWSYHTSGATLQSAAVGVIQLFISRHPQEEQVRTMHLLAVSEPHEQWDRRRQCGYPRFAGLLVH